MADLAPGIRLRNFSTVQRESAAMGVVGAASVFLPVLLVRLGGTNADVALLTALPALGGFLLAIPAGTFLQSRRNVIPWYAGTRAVLYLVYASMALAVALAPRDLVIPLILALWAMATLPGTVSAVASNVMLNAVAGPARRMDLLARRYGIAGLTTAITVALVGQALGAIEFPLNYQLAFVGLSVAGMVACTYSARIAIPDHARVVPRGADVPRRRLGGYLELLASERAFVSFVSRRSLLVFGTSLAAPLVPLWYLREAHAPDAWVGIIGTGQSLALLAGYFGWRRLARRRNPRLLAAVTTLGIALYPALLLTTRDLPLIVGVTVYGSFMLAGINLVLFDELMKTIPSRHIVTLSGVENSLSNLTAVIAPLVAAALADSAGLGIGLAAAAALMLAGAMLLILRPAPQADPEHDAESWETVPAPPEPTAPTAASVVGAGRP